MSAEDAPVVLPAEGTPVEVVGRDAMVALGRALGETLVAGDLVLLSGDLGAGKTTLTQGIGAALQVRGHVTSPTYSIAQTYPSLVGGPALVHVDAYRLSGTDALLDLDLPDLLPTSVIVVEWADDRLDELSDHPVVVRLERPRGGVDTDGPDSRTVSISR